jgi:UDP-N-acetylglucosamine--N-acetylmuramyl-(pentapeptide) pyrophosphoryl-undecaprenol N-acetylglucosamine transferase
MAGGTGGHVFPALTMAHALQAQGVTIRWLGTERGIEARLVPEHGFELICIPVTGLRGKGFFSLIANGFKLINTFWQVLKIVKRYQPDVVVGMGGYASGPGGVASWLLRKPLIIHEQNAIPGFTNRILSKLAKRTLESYPDSFPKTPRVAYTGNLVRTQICQLPEPAVRFATRQQQPLHVLILGGSQGAQVLNQIVPAALQRLSQEQSIAVWHQTGQATFTQTEERYKAANLSARVAPFIDDMAQAYEWADVVICRAGATTIAELAAVGVASILIPYPHAADDHQTRNAMFLQKQQAAVLLPQSQASVESLFEQIRTLCRDRQTLLNMAQAARNTAVLDATVQVVKHCMQVAAGLGMDHESTRHSLAKDRSNE